jgi:hypothetical protein
MSQPPEITCKSMIAVFIAMGGIFELPRIVSFMRVPGYKAKNTEWKEYEKQLQTAMAMLSMRLSTPVEVAVVPEYPCYNGPDQKLAAIFPPERSN